MACQQNMPSIMAVFSPVVVFLMMLSCASSLSDESLVFYSSRGGQYFTRVLCPYVMECTGIANSVFWSFQGDANPIESIETNTSYYGTLQNNTVVTSSLIFPSILVEHDTSYACNVLTNQKTSVVPFILKVEKDVISIKPASNVTDISNNKIGDTVTVDILIETCLTNVIVSIYKGKDRVYNGVINNNQHESFIIHYPLNIIDTTCTGQYGVRVYGNEFTTSLTFFNVTGTPMINE